MDMLSLNPHGLLARLFRRDERPDPTPRFNPNDPYSGPESLNPYYSWYQNQITLGQERLELYIDYEDMDYDDLISSVLDAIAEDATPEDFITGLPIWVESPNKHIETVANQFLQRVQATERVGMIVREIAKNGDCFEFLHYKRGVGVITHEYMFPQTVFRVEQLGSLMGFSLSDQPQPEERDLMLPWQITHFARLTGRRQPGAQYGDAWIRPARKLYKKLKMSEDAMILYRIRRAPDRDVYYVDCGEAAPMEQVRIIRQWRNLYKKNTFVDSATGKMRSEINPLGFEQDVFWPTSAKNSNGSRVERLAGSSNVGEIFDIEFLVNRLFSTLRAPKDYFGFGDSGGFDKGKTLEQQDVRWARGIKSVQRGVMSGYSRMAQIHMCLLGIDPTAKGNTFTMKMGTVSALEELQRADLYDARLRCMEGLTRVVTDLQGLDKKKWFRFLLNKFGGFREDFLDQFTSAAAKDGEKAPDDPSRGDWGMAGEDLTSREEEILYEAIVGETNIPEFLKTIGLGNGMVSPTNDPIVSSLRDML